MSSKHINDAQVSGLIAEFQRRLPMFLEARKHDPHDIKQDFISRFFSEHILIGDKNSYDGVLQGLLTDEEHSRIDMDKDFTQAWRIFVDLCWVKKQAWRAGLVVGGIILLFAIMIGCLLALPHIAGPTGE